MKAGRKKYRYTDVGGELGKHIQGGDGQTFFATAGGKNPDGMAEAIANALSFVG